MPGAAAGSTTRRMVWNLVAPVASDASRIERGTARQRLLRRHDHDRHRQQAERQRRPQDAAGAEGRRRQPLGEERRSIDAADEVDEEAEAEDAEDDRGHAGQVVDARCGRCARAGPAARTRAGRARPARRTGTAIMLMSMTIITVPKIAGKMPPSVFDSRGSPLRNSQRRLA